jgi:hypothetical protein
MANIKKIIFTAVAATAVAAAGTAFTDSVSGVPSAQVGAYAHTQIDGAVASDVAYNYGIDGSTVTDVVVTFTGDVDDPAITIQGGFGANGAALDGVVVVTPFVATSTTVTFTPPSTLLTTNFDHFRVLVTTTP